MKDFLNTRFDVSAIHIVSLVKPRNKMGGADMRPDYGIVMKVNGDTEYNFDSGKKIITKPNDILFLPKGLRYTAQCSDGSSSYCINFDLFSPKKLNPFSVTPDNARQLLDQFKSCEHIWRHKKTYYEMKCMANLYSILYDVMNECDSAYLPSNKLEIIRPAIDYIHSNYDKLSNIHIEMLAKMCNVSDTYFRMLFYNRFSISPKKYIYNLRLERAWELLNTGDYSVSEVSFMSGFSDESYFSREFKRHFDMRAIDVKRNRF